MDRLRLWATVTGITVILLGFMVLVSASGSRAELQETHGLGLLLVSLGVFIISIAHYVVGRSVTYAMDERMRDNEKGRRLFPCSICADNAATFWCTTHNTKLCTDCIRRHHDPARCLYKPFLAVKSR